MKPLKLFFNLSMLIAIVFFAFSLKYCKAQTGITNLDFGCFS